LRDKHRCLKIHRICYHSIFHILRCSLMFIEYNSISQPAISQPAISQPRKSKHKYACRYFPIRKKMGIPLNGLSINSSRIIDGIKTSTSFLSISSLSRVRVSGSLANRSKIFVSKIMTSNLFLQPYGRAYARVSEDLEQYRVLDPAVYYVRPADACDDRLHAALEFWYHAADGYLLGYEGARFR